MMPSMRSNIQFAIAEECQANDECDEYTNAYGTNVIEIEYDENDFTDACSERGASISIILRDQDVVPAGKNSKGYRYEFC